MNEVRQLLEGMRVERAEEERRDRAKFEQRNASLWEVRRCLFEWSHAATATAIFIDAHVLIRQGIESTIKSSEQAHLLAQRQREQQAEAKARALREAAEAKARAEAEKAKREADAKAKEMEELAKKEKEKKGGGGLEVKAKEFGVWVEKMKVGCDGLSLSSRCLRSLISLLFSTGNQAECLATSKLEPRVEEEVLGRQAADHPKDRPGYQLDSQHHPCRLSFCRASRLARILPSDSSPPHPPLSRRATSPSSSTRRKLPRLISISGSSTTYPRSLSSRPRLRSPLNLLQPFPSPGSSWPSCLWAMPRASGRF